MSGRRSWMRSLSEHYTRARRAHPDERLLIVFDLDGAVIDQGHSIRRQLLEYDRVHGSDHFHGLEATEVDAHERDVERVLAGRRLPRSAQDDVLDWYVRHARSDRSCGIDRARPGVLEVIRWFQLQPSTFVALTTARPPSLRHDTLRSLNRLGRELQVDFDADLLHMSGPNGSSLLESKVAALRAFACAGFRIIAVVDSEPAAIEALAQTDETGEILFLHACNPSDGPAATPRTVGGCHFDLTALVSESDLPDQVQLVWHGVNDDDNLRHFLRSRVTWGECDVRRDPRGRLVLHHDSFETTPWNRDEPLLALAAAVDAFATHDRNLKLDLKDGPSILDEVVALLGAHDLADDRLWFNARIDVLGAEGFGALRSAYPGAIVQCPVDFLAPLVLTAPRRARAILRMLDRWGISRVSVGWGNDYTVPLFERLRVWGYEVNLYGVHDLASFLRATLLVPRSLTADFNFPDWNYYGRGSGEQRRYHRYAMPDELVAAATR